MQAGGSTMLSNQGLNSARHHAIRGFGMLLALGCAVVFDGSMRASAQGAPVDVALLKDRTVCWKLYGPQRGDTGSLIEPNNPRGGLVKTFGSGSVTSFDPLTITQKTGGFRIVRVPCPLPSTASAPTTNPWGLGNVQNIDAAAQSFFGKSYIGVQGGGLWGNGDMTHPAGADFASNANLSGGYGGLILGTPCMRATRNAAKSVYEVLYADPFSLEYFDQPCIRAEGSVNFGSISGSGAPNVGDEINHSKIGTFGTLNAQVLIPLQGIANQGTRLAIQAASIPQGSQVFVPSVAYLFRQGSLFVGGGLAVGETKTNFADDTTTDTRIGFNAQAGFIFPVSPGSAVRINYFYMNFGNMTVPTAAGNGHVNFWAQGVNFALEFHY
jgi:hypothetical protein